MTSIKEAVRDRDIALARYNELGNKFATLEEGRKAVDAALAPPTGNPDNESWAGIPQELNCSEMLDLKRVALYARRADLKAEASELSLQISRAHAHLAEMEARKVEVVLGAMSTKREQLIAEIKEVLAELSAPIASLITADIAQSRLIGEQFDGDLEKNPEMISGRALASKLLDGIPLQLRPPNLYSGEVEDAALWFAECLDALDPDPDKRQDATEAR